MQQSLIIAYITAVVMVAHGYIHDLRVSIVPTRLYFNTKQGVEITLNYTNKGPDTVMIYKWYLPNQELSDPLFEVTRDGKRVEYVGPMIKRRAPTADDMIPLESDKHVHTTIQLSSVYNMTETGNYAVQFKVNVGSMLLTSARRLGIDNTPTTGIGETILQSTPATLFAVGRSNVLIEKIAQVNTQTRSTTPTYIGCSASQITLIASAVRSAISYSTNSMQYLTALNSVATTRYTTWFGKYSLNNLITLRTHFININAVFNTKPMSFDCGCNWAAYAYVYPSMPYKINLCSLFWSASMTGTDSKAGTLIHETSHFTIVGATNDNTYGQTNCKILANNDPTKALNNADSHEYFAENNPILT